LKLASALFVFNQTVANSPVGETSFSREFDLQLKGLPPFVPGEFAAGEVGLSFLYSSSWPQPTSQRS